MPSWDLHLSVESRPLMETDKSKVETGSYVPTQTQIRERNRTDYQDAQGQSQTHTKGDLSLSCGGGPGGVLFCSKVTLAQTLSTCLSL